MASGYTLGEARTRISRSFLDDKNNRRWGVTEIDESLQQAIDDCRSELINENIFDRFTEQYEVNSGGTGTVDLSGISPGVRSVQKLTAKYGTAWQPVRGITRGDNDRDDTSSRLVRIYYSPLITIPTNTGHPLLSSAGVQLQGTSRTFEEWVMLEAAYKMCALKEPKSPRNQMLDQQRVYARTRCLEENPNARARAFPKTPAYVPFLYWSFSPPDQAIYLTRRFV